MKYIESPKIYKGKEKSLFLAGGIQNCPDWQHYMAMYLLKDADIVLFNPRRKDFPIDDPSAAQAQIKWEYEYLRKATAILFWFPRETLCPIVLYELGAWSMTDKKIFVGVHPLYKRKQDVEIQTGLARPKIGIVHSEEALAAQVIRDLGEIK